MAKTPRDEIPSRVNVIVTLHDVCASDRDRFEKSILQLESKGLMVRRRMPRSGIVAGEVEESQLDSLRLLEQVRAVELDAVNRPLDQ